MYLWLHDGWTVRPADDHDVPADVRRVIPARVPGCVHTDLHAAGLIPDPYVDDNEHVLRWIGRTAWLYSTRFEWNPEMSPGAEAVDLVCTGLDTVATVQLSGSEIGRTSNMHRSYRFPLWRRRLTDQEELPAAPLTEGDNSLQIRFASPQLAAEQLRDELGPRPGAYSEPYNFIRKMACNFGWDWGPTLVTAGIWRPIGLHAWRTARLAQVRPLVTVDGGVGRVELHVELEWAADEQAEVTASVAGATGTAWVESGQSSAMIVLEVPRPRLWWPHGYGEQDRYDLTVTVNGPGGEVLDSWQRKIGFRSVELDTVPDAEGTPYTLLVNETPIFVRGANWIPDDCFPHRVTHEQYRARIADAAAANVNYLRVWGGGIYESDAFYDLADERGMLVGQDFLFACAAYPEEEPIRSEVIAEARENVSRLMYHPSLVTWTGNNECLWGYHDWGWKDHLGEHTWGSSYYLDLLPGIVADLDPTRPYWPGSPYSGSPEKTPNDPAHGTMHIWDVWNTHDYSMYRSHRPRFAAEFGYQGPPAFATLREAIHGELSTDTPALNNHQKAKNGDAKLARGLDTHLPPPWDFDDWHYLTQLNQARAIQVGVEHFRSLRPTCMGTIVWQLNDCWPVISWSAIDGAGRRKPMWYALRRAYADQLLTIQPDKDGFVLVAVNDGTDAWSTEVALRRTTLAGETVAAVALQLDVPAGSTVRRPLPDTLTATMSPRDELLLADANGLRAWWFFAEDRDIAYPSPEFDAAVERHDGVEHVTITARTIMRDIALFPDRLDPAATVDEMLVTLLPGESAVFTVRSSADLDPADLTARPVLRCVNDLIDNSQPKPDVMRSSTRSPGAHR